MTPQEKTDLNPFNCDHETQHVRDDNGQCVNKPPSQRFDRLPFVIEPFALRFDNGLELETTVRLECAPIEDRFKDLYGESKEVFTTYEHRLISNFFEFLEDNGVAGSDVSAELFFQYTEAYPTDWCILKGNFTNISGDYTYLSNRCDQPIYVQDILINQGDGLRGYFPFYAPNFTRLPCPISETLTETQFSQDDNRDIWQDILLPAGGNIQSLRLTIGVQVSPGDNTNKTLTLSPE